MTCGTFFVVVAGFPACLPALRGRREACYYRVFSGELRHSCINFLSRYSLGDCLGRYVEWLATTRRFAVRSKWEYRDDVADVVEYLEERCLYPIRHDDASLRVSIHLVGLRTRGGSLRVRSPAWFRRRANHRFPSSEGAPRSRPGGGRSLRYLGTLRDLPVRAGLARGDPRGMMREFIDNLRFML